MRAAHAGGKPYLFTAATAASTREGQEKLRYREPRSTWGFFVAPYDRAGQWRGALRRTNIRGTSRGGARDHKRDTQRLQSGTSGDQTRRTRHPGAAGANELAEKAGLNGES